jgi:septal ring factor EnvC (AmiA/AmiB activator)
VSFREQICKNHIRQNLGRKKQKSTCFGIFYTKIVGETYHPRKDLKSVVASRTSLVTQLQACNTPQENEEDAPKEAEKPKEKPEKEQTPAEKSDMACQTDPMSKGDEEKIDRAWKRVKQAEARMRELRSENERLKEELRKAPKNKDEEEKRLQEVLEGEGIDQVAMLKLRCVDTMKMRKLVQAVFRESKGKYLCTHKLPAAEKPRQSTTEKKKERPLP